MTAQQQEEIARKVQERLLLLQQIQSESEAIQRRIIELEVVQSELDRTIESLEYFDSLDGSVEALMNLGGGVFAYVDVKDSKKMLVDIGAGVIVEKEVKDAIETLKKKKEKIQQSVLKFEQILQQLAAQAERIQAEIAEMTKER
ncbi:prefoldin subunit alpha [Archaeoglobus veneficus]|uniref:Prefoldin subunit alpha n=1 Tax=Archaeoglobus veneficus (strain DSM 11195 / SNP6) TaxID=693661 RepID=F2KQV7_ARCVS|nr:prefoldin subunit alpha [Archaeoglobus veneficus]AEA47763.1 Prefoldin subunit alpha [Archaeoglobus veneficus SNP6]